MRTKILKAAMIVAGTTPLWMLTRKAIAKQADCAPSLVTYYLGTRDEIITAIVECAVETNNVEIVARAVALDHSGVRGASEKLKQAALKFLAS